MENIADLLRVKSNKVTNRNKLDIIFNEIIYPLMLDATKSKKFLISINSFGCRTKQDLFVNSLFPKVRTLQDLVETEMRPYLVEKGFKVSMMRPAYYTEIKW